MDILDDMGVSKLSAKVFLKVNYSFKILYENWPRCLTKQTYSLSDVFWFNNGKIGLCGWTNCFAKCKYMPH